MNRCRRPAWRRFEQSLAIVVLLSAAWSVRADEPQATTRVTPLTVADLFRKPADAAETHTVTTATESRPAAKGPAARIRAKPVSTIHRQIADLGASTASRAVRREPTGARPSTEPTFKTRLWDLLVVDPVAVEWPTAPIVMSPGPRTTRVAGKPAALLSTFRPQGYFRSEQGYFRLTQDVAPMQPLPQTPSAAPSAIEQPNQPLPALPMLGFGSAAENIAALAPERQQTLAPIAPVANATTQQALAVNSQPDLAEAISKDVLAVQTEWRSAVSENPYIRGFKNRQIYAQLDGQYFEPVRWDLDTVVNKVDPGIVQDVIVVEGPYSVQYGPGFTFLDIVTRPTPRN
ncbi:MAG: hypothetical protein B7Z73_06685, partial [Planctomycetia bacterium 21-64-5]